MKRIAAMSLITAFLFAFLPGCTPEPIWFPVVVVRISKEYANINTNVTQPQLAAHGIRHGTKFNVKFKDRTMEALLGKKYRSSNGNRFGRLWRNADKRASNQAGGSQAREFLGACY